MTAAFTVTELWREHRRDGDSERELEFAHTESFASLEEAEIYRARTMQGSTRPAGAFDVEIGPIVPISGRSAA